MARFSRRYSSVEHLELRAHKRYGVWQFVKDATMTILTHGLWLVWIFVREMSR